MYANDAQEPHGFIKACDSFYILITANTFFLKEERVAACVCTPIRTAFHYGSGMCCMQQIPLLLLLLRRCHAMAEGGRGEASKILYMLILFCLLTPLLLLPTETFAASQRYQAAGQSGGRSFFGSRDPGQLGGHARGVYALITVTRSLALAIAI